MECSWLQNLETGVDSAEHLVVTLILFCCDLVWNFIIRELMLRATRFICIGIVSSLGSVGLAKRNSLPILGMSCCRCVFFMRLYDGRIRWRRCLLRHKVIDTVDRRDLVVSDASPLAAMTWLADSWGKLSGLGNMGHAVSLKSVKIGARVDGSLDRSGTHVGCLVRTNILTDCHVVRLIACTAAGVL